MKTYYAFTNNFTFFFEREHANVFPQGQLALSQFIYQYAKALISKCICLGSLKQKKVNKNELIAILDSQIINSPPSMAADLFQRRQKTIHAANQNRLDDYEFKDSISISFDKVNLLEGIQSIRLKKFNSVHLMITKNLQLLISTKNMEVSSNDPLFFSKYLKEVQSQQRICASIISMNTQERREQKIIKKGMIQQQSSQCEAFESSNENESIEEDSSQAG